MPVIVEDELSEMMVMPPLAAVAEMPVPPLTELAISMAVAPFTALVRMPAAVVSLPAWTVPVEVMLIRPLPERVAAEMPALVLPLLSTTMLLAELTVMPPLSLIAPMPALPGRPSGLVALVSPVTVMALPPAVVIEIRPDGAPPVFWAKMPAL